MSASPSSQTDFVTLADLARSFLEHAAAHEVDPFFQPACELLREHGGRLFTTPTAKGNARELAIVNGLPCVYGGTSLEERESDGIALGDTEAGDRALALIVASNDLAANKSTIERGLLEAIARALPEVAKALLKGA